MPTPRRLALVTHVVLSACEPSPLEQGRRATKRGDLRAAAELYAAVDASSSRDKTAVAEARDGMRHFVTSVMDSKRPDAVTADELAAAMKIAEQLGDDSSVRSLWGLKAKAAETAGAIADAVDATRKSFAPAAAQRADEAVARLLQNNPKYAPGGEELTRLVAKYPASATIGIAQAAWVGEQGRFADAMAQYDRCSGLENQTMEQAMFIGAQKAVLQTYLKQAHGKSSPARKRR